jgi:hypothetical protein
MTGTRGRKGKRSGWTEAHKTGCFAQRAERGLDLTEWSVSVAFSPPRRREEKVFLQKKDRKEDQEKEMRMFS